MQISFGNLLRVIFMLSTIVYVTDCCSSRILLLREHTMKFIHDQGFLNTVDINQLHLVENHRKQLEQLHNDPGEFMRDVTKTSDTINFNDLENANLLEMELSSSSSSSSLPDLSTTTTPTITITATEDNEFSELTSTTTELDGQLIVNEESTPAPAPAPPPNIKLENMPTTTLKTGSNIQWLKCGGQYLTDFCLNRGKCFRFSLGNHSIFSCECADGYVGERCESKSINGQYVLTTKIDAQPKILMARIVFSFPMLIALSIIYIACGAVIVFKCPHNCNTGKHRTSGIYVG